MLTRWDKIRSVERMQAHIEANLTEQITMEDLARAARYSRWHAARLFRELTGLAPFEYIRLRRLSAAAQRLREGPDRVLDVALDFVFDSHEGFTRAFARNFGVSPTHFRRSRAPIQLFLPPRLRDWYHRRQTGDPTMAEDKKIVPVFVQVLDHPARRFVVRRAREATHYFEYCEELGCQIWDQLTEVENALQEPMGLWLPPNLRPTGTSTYVQAVQVPTDFQGPVPEGFETMDLPPCKMMVFQGPPFEEKDFEDAISSIWDVMNSYKPETYGFKWADEDGPRFQLRPEGWRGYIEGRPVRSLS